MARWHSCNVLQVGSDASQLWQFDARSRDFRLNREQTVSAGEPYPAGIVAKGWTSLFQSKLNIAWLPPENVFIRVAQFPASSPEETRSMVELQLEKLSPIPVTQAVWTFHVLPQATGSLQSVIVTIATRSAVEEFLGRLEERQFLADRLELPIIDELQATTINEDGAWIYPGTNGAANTAAVAWWFGGVLQNLDRIALPQTPDRAAALRDQLTQMAWAGELEGWLTAPPAWHLVAGEAAAKEWEPALREGLDQPVQILEPLPPVQRAALSARRAAQANGGITMLPAEFADRYRRQFQDRLWMRGLGAALGLYVVGVLIYFIAVAFLRVQTGGVEQQVRDAGGSYTNVLKLRARYDVLKERQELKYAALNCWEAVAEVMPEGLTLDSMNFTDGRKLVLSGTAPSGQVMEVNDFSGKLRKWTKPGGETLFNPLKGDPLQQQTVGANIRWSFGLELKRSTEKP